MFKVCVDGDESSLRDVEALSPEDAAEIFAEDDEDDARYFDGVYLLVRHEDEVIYYAGLVSD